MLVSEILTAAGRKIGVVQSGESLTTDETADALTALQTMLRSWAAEKINVHASIRETHTLVSGTYLYTWGTAGDISTARPNQIISVSVTDSSGVTHPVDIISSNEYDYLTVKATIGRPNSAYFQFTYPSINVYLYPVPNAAETLNITSIKPFTETSSFSSASDTISVPVNYEEPIIYNLAMRMASEFGVATPRDVITIGNKSYNRIVNLNSANYIEPIKLSFPAGAGKAYNINSN